jgi:hypothetical protein
LKKNIRPLEDSLSIVKKMRGVRYFWKENEFFDIKNLNEPEIGFIAQEIQYLEPTLVFGSEEEGWRVKYMEVISLCLDAIKEQTDLLQFSENRLDILEELVQK